MEQENVTPDIYEREEQCIKAIKTVRRAVIMRIVVAGLMIWAVVSAPTQPIVWGLMAFVLLIDVLGALPLISEWKKQKARLQELIALEEE